MIEIIISLRKEVRINKHGVHRKMPCNMNHYHTRWDKTQLEII